MSEKPDPGIYWTHQIKERVILRWWNPRPVMVWPHTNLSPDTWGVPQGSTRGFLTVLGIWIRLIPFRWHSQFNCLSIYSSETGPEPEPGISCPWPTAWPFPLWLAHLLSKSGSCSTGSCPSRHRFGFSSYRLIVLSYWSRLLGSRLELCFSLFNLYSFCKPCILIQIYIFIYCVLCDMRVDTGN